jgi:hypothetical protein
MEALDQIDPNAIALPQRHFADNMLRWYRRNVYSLFPFLHWPMFESQYHAVWEQPEQPARPGFDDLVFRASLNMVLALACLRSDAIPLEQSQYLADEFYNRSMRLVSIETLDTASIAIVQMLSLRALYLYFSGKADRCWLMSGAAIRVAIGMGLNIPPKRTLSQLEREMRRRVWHAGCVSLDQ